MGSQQTRNTSPTTEIIESMDGKFSNDICLLIFSFINSEDEFTNFVTSYSKVCNQWRKLILLALGLRAKASSEDVKRLKFLVSNGILKYCILHSITINNTRLKGGEIRGICCGKYSSLMKELNVCHNLLNDKSISIISSSLLELKILRANRNKITDHGVKCIAKSENLKNLQVLDLSSNLFTVEGVKSLCSSQFIRNLTEINLGGCKIGLEGVKCIVNNFKLKVLELSETTIENEGLIEITKSPNMVNLQILNVNNNGIGEKGAIALAHSEFIKNLTRLNISSNYLGPVAGKELLGSEILRNVKSLKVASCHFEVDGAKALAINPHARNLTSLSMANNSIGSEGACALGLSENMTNVWKLNLNANTIGDKGMLGLGNLEFGFTTKLEILKVGANEIGDIGIGVFTLNAFPKLKFLTLSFNLFTNTGNCLLKSSNYLKKTYIDTFGCPHLFQLMVHH